MAFLSYALLLACNHGLQHEHTQLLKVDVSLQITFKRFWMSISQSRKKQKNRTNLNYHIMLGTPELKQISPAILYALCFTPDREISQCLLCWFNHHHLQLHQTDYVQTVLTSSLCCSTFKHCDLNLVIILPFTVKPDFPLSYRILYC